MARIIPFRRRPAGFMLGIFVMPGEKTITCRKNFSDFKKDHLRLAQAAINASCERSRIKS